MDHSHPRSFVRRWRSATIARRAGPVVVLGAMFLGSACAGGGGSASQPSATAPRRAAIAIDTFMFSPRTLTVAAGTTVTWTNRDAILHTVTAGTRTYDPNDSGRVVSTDKTGLFDLQLDGRGATARFTFARRGTYRYFCNRHPGMEAQIRVV
ncbi:MAG: hypothetical protein HYX34_01925 [Actinobacteria bacterium]|nr:hypothetical protein [Actinomycetota bacterium]